uniref:Uncharacterized protein n=1 Tax=Phage sp. ct17O1 TaxID=2825789 RepID=A0A8S5PJV3_9VIRU|nr:MAG TPA: hypothetical protein [Phage sp. ct17O1]
MITKLLLLKCRILLDRVDLRETQNGNQCL